MAGPAQQAYLLRAAEEAETTNSYTHLQTLQQERNTIRRMIQSNSMKSGIGQGLKMVPSTVGRREPLPHLSSRSSKVLTLQSRQQDMIHAQEQAAIIQAMQEYSGRAYQLNPSRSTAAMMSEKLDCQTEDNDHLQHPLTRSDHPNQMQPFITSDEVLYNQQQHGASTESTNHNFDDKDYGMEVGQQSVMSSSRVKSHREQPSLDNFARVVSHRRDDKHDQEDDHSMSQVQQILQQTEHVKQQLMKSSTSQQSLRQSRLNSVRNSIASSKQNSTRQVSAIHQSNNEQLRREEHNADGGVDNDCIERGPPDSDLVVENKR